jgi:hypothetical protein
VHCALGLSLLQLLARPSIWAGSAWAGSPLPEAGEPQPTAPGGGAQSIPVNRRRGEAGKLTRSKLSSRGARFWGQKGESSPELGCSRRRQSGELNGDSVVHRSMAAVDEP